MTDRSSKQNSGPIRKKQGEDSFTASVSSAAVSRARAPSCRNMCRTARHSDVSYAFFAADRPGADPVTLLSLFFHRSPALICSCGSEMGWSRLAHPNGALIDKPIRKKLCRCLYDRSLPPYAFHTGKFLYFFSASRRCSQEFAARRGPKDARAKTATANDIVAESRRLAADLCANKQIPSAFADGGSAVACDFRLSTHFMRLSVIDGHSLTD